jgi:serine/threonine protein kinase
MSNEPGILPEPISFGKYYLLELISVGGMAEIYKAKAFGVEGFERLLAVKKILSSIAEDESFIEMFVDEAKIAGQLNHPNIAQIFDLGKVDDSYYIALEYISGEDLKTIFERARRIGAEVDIPQICYIVMKVCEGLEYAHNKKDSQGNPLNIVHRDISPQNILLSYEGEVKIIDFGIAKAQGKTSQTQVGVLKGKFSYMSPEQVRGLHVDHRSDIFSLGIVLYEMLTLERLFLGESDFDTLEKIRKVEMSPPSLYNPNIPDELEEIVLKALAQDPDDRFQSTGAFAEALERFMRNQDYYYKNTDLADFMKDAFREDLEFEQKKLEYFRDLDLQPPNQEEEDEEEDEGLAWDEDEMETQIFDRDDRDGSMPPPQTDLADSDIVYADEDVPSEPRNDSERVEVVGPDQEVDVVEPGEGEPPTTDYDRNDTSPTTSQPATPAGGNEPADLDETQEADAPDLADLAPKGPGPAGEDDASDDPQRRRRPTAQIGDEGVPDEPRSRAPSPSPASSSSDGDDTFLRPAWIGGIALAVMCLAGAGFLLWNAWSTSNQARIKFSATPNTPETVRVLIDDTQVYQGSLPHTHVFEPTGRKTKIEVAKKGYESDVGTQKLQSGYTYQFEVDLKKAETGTGEVFVKSEPSGAEVTVDGESLEDPTPVTAGSLTPGEHAFRVDKEGYLEAERTVTLEDGDETELNVQLKPETISLTVESDPEEASFELVDTETGEIVADGETPKTAETLDASKTYRVTVEHDGYETWEETFEPGTETNPVVTAELSQSSDESEPRRVARHDPDPEPDPSNDSEPEIDLPEPRQGGASGSSGGSGSDDPTGSPGSNQGSNASGSNETASATSSGDSSSESGGGGGSEPSSEQQPGSRAETTTSDESESASNQKETSGSSGGSKSDESSKPGTLTVQSIPAAKVYVDGEDMGYTPLLNYELSPGKHEVRLKKKALGLNKTYYIDIESGGSKKIINKK